MNNNRKEKFRPFDEKIISRIKCNCCMKTICEESSTLKTTIQLLNVENKSIITDRLSGRNKTFFTSDFMTLVFVSEKGILTFSGK